MDLLVAHTFTYTGFRAIAKGITEEEGIVDVQSDEDAEDDKAAADDLMQEQMFVFEKYEAVSIIRFFILSYLMR